MRIISGTHKGRHITPDKNFTARPTTDFAKENIFNVISNYIDFEDIDVLDLFSGTGSISYEFASRGARKVVSIEKNANHAHFILQCAKELKFPNIQLFRSDVFVACKKFGIQKFDIIFADPPYKLTKIDEIPDLIFNNNLLKDDGIAIIEHPESVDFSGDNRFSEVRRYGSVNFSLFRQQLPV